MQEKLNFLSELKIFSNLSQDELARIADLCKAWKFDKDAVIAWQKEVADKLYIVRSGVLNGYQIDGQGNEAIKKTYIEKDYFDELWLFGEDVHDMTIRAETDGSLYMIDQVAFESFVEQNPLAVLDMVPQAWDELDQMAISPTISNTYRNMQLLPGELIVYESKRTGLLLLAALFEPILWILTGLLSIAFFGMVYRTITKSSLLLQYPTVVTIAIIAACVPGAVYGLWHYIDWVYDYLIVTNRHIIHREFVLRRFANEIQKLPIDQVQSVATLRGRFFEQWLGIGTVKITTAAQANPLVFEHVTKPGDAEAAYNKVKGSVASADTGRERLALREAIQAHFGVSSQINWEPEIYEDIDVPNLKFRRHIFVLFGSLIRPLLGFTISSALAILPFNLLTGLLSYSLLPVNERPILQTILIFICLFALGGVYMFANSCVKAVNAWVNKGIVGMAIGLIDGGATSIHSIRVNQTVWGRMFGYGNVMIGLGGGAAVPFEKVSAPNRVRKQMLARWNAIRRQQGLPGIINPDAEPLAQRMQLPELVYKKHWYVFVSTAFVPLLAFIAILVGYIFLLSINLLPLNLLIAIGVACLLALIVSFGFIAYHLEDWRDDQFLVTASQIIDVDKKPFRLDEDRKVAGIDNVQNVNIEQDFLGTFLGFGNVIIDTAGANADIVFENVVNPIRVQSDIFQRREEFRRMGRQRDAVNRRREILLALDEYQQLREQTKIPRLTPEKKKEKDEPQFVQEDQGEEEE